jgi:ABC-type dipeptide/oligopeptide/nickel transport system permease subunit
MEQTDLTKAEHTPRLAQPFSERVLNGLRELKRANKLTLLAIAILVFFVLAAVFPGLFATFEPNELHPPDALSPPSATYLLGTDDLGRDIWSRIIYGSRIAIFIAVAAMALASAIGVPLGLIAGMRKGIVDGIIMRTLDAILAFPVIIFAILLVAAFDASVSTIIIVMAIVYIPRFGRLVRGNVLALSEREFVNASRALGATDRRIMWNTMFPNTLATILVQASIGMAFTILLEASLSYLGLGVQPPTATWGTMLRNAQRYAFLAPWYVISPGVCIFLIVLIFNFLGDRLRDRLDPMLRGSS